MFKSVIFMIACCVNLGNFAAAGQLAAKTGEIKPAVAKSDVTKPDVTKPDMIKPATVYKGMSYLDNGVIRLGINLNLGGAITYLADSTKRVNVINNYDWGRQVQMSFYSGPNPFEPNGKKPSVNWKRLGWNPIQSGDYAGFRSRVIAHKNSGKTLYVKCIPMQWPLNNEPGECTFESWIYLDKDSVHVRSRINNNRTDKTQYGGRSQELPAVYTNGPLYRLITYTGDKPFTNDSVTRIVKKRKGGFPWEHFIATENWSALLRDDNWGLGVWNPGSFEILGGFAGKPGKGGSKDSSTGYISPINREILDWNIVFEYKYVLILGNLKQIRRYVYDHAERPRPPCYIFNSDRQHWSYRNAVDTGWPIRGELYVLLGKNDPQLIGPTSFWQAKDAKKLFIRAAFHTRKEFASVMWKTFANPDFNGNEARFKIISDGNYHTYEINLGESPGYSGIITGLRFDPVTSGAKGEYVKIKSIGFEMR